MNDTRVFVKGITDWIFNSALSLMSFIRKLVQSTSSFIGKDLSWIADFFDYIIKKVVDIALAMQKWTSDKLGFKIPGISEMVSSLKNIVTEKTKDFFKPAKTGEDESWLQWIKRQYDEKISPLGGQLSKAFTSIVDSWKGAKKQFESMKRDAPKQKADFDNKVKQEITKITDGMKGLQNKIPVKKDWKAMTILVAEDSSTVRTIITNILKGMGCGSSNIVETVDGQKAVTILKTTKVDLIVSDWHMPHLTGFELLKIIRAVPGLKNIPFLMVTAEGQKESVMEAIKAGVDNYIVKPFTSDQLIKKLKNIVSKKFN